MTPEERVDALKGLLGRLRLNAGGRLAIRSGDEEEFVPKSVIKARAEAEVAAAAAAVAAWMPGTGTGDEGGGREARSGAAVASAPPLELDLYDESFDEPTAPGAPDEIEEHALDEAAMAPPPRARPEVAPAPPASSTRAVLPAVTPPVPLPFDTGDDNDVVVSIEKADEEGEAFPTDDPDWALERPTRQRDALARTAQNPVPAAMFERAVAESRELEEDLADEEAALESESAGATSAEGGAPVTAPGGGHDDSPISSKQPVDLDRAADVGLDSEPPPQSGEMASQRQPAATSARRSLALDEPTPTTEEGARVAREADKLHAEALPSAPPPTRPGVIGRRPLAAAAFLQILDAALGLGEGPG